LCELTLGIGFTTLSGWGAGEAAVIGRILVVDDETAICTMLMRTLREVALECQYVTDPEEALELLRNDAFDVLITDLRMPGMDGLELIGRAKRIQPRCEVVVMSGHASRDVAREAQSCGAVATIHKPFSVEDELIPIVRSVLAARVARMGSGRPEGEAREVAAELHGPAAIRVRRSEPESVRLDKA
jgi:DNA-binding NtrC family response regulator